MRSVTPEESALWARVAATIQPLSREKPASVAVEKPPQFPTKPGAIKVSSVALRARAKAVPIAEKTLDGSWDRKLRNGAIEPSRVIDLHGLSLDGAWGAIDRSLEQAIARRERVVLLITGHHRSGASPVQRGRIRAAAHDWLATSRHALDIAAVRGAHGRHGGGGSLYIILKRNSPRR